MRRRIWLIAIRLCAIASVGTGLLGLIVDAPESFDLLTLGVCCSIWADVVSGES